MSTRSGIICAGNWIVDLVHEIDHWPRESDLVRIGRQVNSIGGGAANVVSVLQRLNTGLHLWPMGAIGDDDYGTFITENCQQLGLPTDLIIRKPGVATAHTHVMSVPGQSRTFFYQGGANDTLAATDFELERINAPQARLFYLGYLILLEQLDRIDERGSTEAETVLKRARDCGMLTCVDLVSAERPDFATSVGAALPQVDYLILNEVEAARATGREAQLSDDPEQASIELAAMGHALIAAGVRRAVVIHYPQKSLWTGADGEQIWAQGETLAAQDIVSPLGAGDAFCAGILYALHQNWSPSQAMALAHASARASLGGTSAAESIPCLEDLMAQITSGKTPEHSHNNK